MGVSNGECDVEDFISPQMGDQEIVIMTLHWVTNAKATLALRLLVGKWKKCQPTVRSWTMCNKWDVRR